MVSPSTLSAINAYRNQLNLAQGQQETAAGQEAAGGPSFAKLVGEALQEASDIAYKTEAVQMEALTGKVDLSDLVTAVASAELTLNTVVAVRDKVINAYQDILRMSI